MSQLLQNAAYGTALILAAALLRRALGDRLIPEARLALWAVCLFRLLTPAAPESVLSLWGPLSRFFKAAASAPAAPALSPTHVFPQAVPAPEPGIAWERALVILWPAASVALAVWYAVSWRRTRRAVACATPLDRNDGRYAALPKCARLREGPMEGAPLTFGTLRPTVVLSPGLDGAELDCVLAHEGVHASRRDNLWHYAMALATAVHWWNPAVWLMARLLRRDIELSCDRAALRKLGTDRRAEYAHALVSLATRTDGPAFCQTFGRKAAEERIRSIMKFKKTSVIGAVFTLTLVLAVTAAFASEPQKTSDEYDGVKAAERLSVTVGDATNPATPTYVEYVEAEGDIKGVIMGEGEISCDGALPVRYEIRHPGFIEDGEKSSVVTSRVYSYSSEDGEAADGIIDSYYYSYSLENGETLSNVITVRLAENPSADGDTDPYSLCSDADCGVDGSHVHVNAQVVHVEYQNPCDDIDVGIFTREPDRTTP